MKPTMMTASLMIALLTNFTATQAEATVTVVAFRTCADWAKDRKSNSLVGSSALIGMLNGLAYASDKDFWANLETDQVFFWMDRYCDNNPLSNTIDGAITLMNETTGTTYSRFIR